MISVKLSIGNKIMVKYNDTEPQKKVFFQTYQTDV